MTFESDFAPKLVELARNRIPPAPTVTNKDGEESLLLKTTIKAVSELHIGLLTECLELVDLNLSEYYTSIEGPDWKVDKLQEMKEDGLVYCMFHSSLTGKPVAFFSFMVTIEEGENVVYLFEIHVSPKWQNAKLGTRLLEYVSDITRSLSCGFPDIAGIMLTVFPENRALGWYFKNGFTFASHSPRDKTLRFGKVLKPDYYLLFKNVDPR
ncbi:unnamed protein product [Kuraishia capsulata CBS 1993]|uniref:N-alpha-acetyltransferase 40 n=1 Tax=Kuraishia capsulata CBS 1993 TaxID=1382522 RepID=W6MLL6_9ASCO|nr:uncharacterized protein KUCA_T00003369001 [Kuraishia capsulata CBS 1993]CDK27391.1 unnamed protein product [Kuraishia capsulata CBS 1993]